MRGRKPQLQAIEGGLARTPPAPSWMPDEARAEWKRVMPGLVERRVLTDADMATVEAYCIAVGVVRRATVTIAREGDTTTDDKGRITRHPAYQTKFQALAEMRRLAAELGLTPASRAKAPATGGQTDEWSGLVDG